MRNRVHRALIMAGSGDLNELEHGHCRMGSVSKSSSRQQRVLFRLPPGTGSSCNGGGAGPAIVRTGENKEFAAMTSPAGSSPGGGWSTGRGSRALRRARPHMPCLR